MKSTGEVMGLDATFGIAYAKSQAAAYATLPVKGRVFVSVANRDKRSMVFPVKLLNDLGFEVLATEGTAEVLRRNGVRVSVLGKHSQPREGLRDCVDAILDGEVDIIVNTPWGSGGGPGLRVRRLRNPHGGASSAGVPCVTTIQGAAACVQGIEAVIRGEVGVRSLQEWHAVWAELRAKG